MRRGRRFVPIECLQIIAHKLFVETRRAGANAIFIHGPETGGIGSQTFVNQQQLIVNLNNRLSPKISKELSLRQQGLSKEIKACAWKAQTRLHQRMMQLLARGKQRNKVTVAVARELCGFLWQIFQLMVPRMTPAPDMVASTKELRFGGN